VGKGPEFDKYTNYIMISHPNGEYSQLAHIQKGSAKVKKGEVVKEGQLLAVTGMNGWMEPEMFGPEIHFYVFKLLPEGKFKGLQIRFRKD
jgi:murein DD-endopeptidase MepM/ murein hydrolase activator NlpD